MEMRNFSINNGKKPLAECSHKVNKAGCMSSALIHSPAKSSLCELQVQFYSLYSP